MIPMSPLFSIRKPENHEVKARVFSIVLALWLLAGCGYGFGVRLPEGIDTLEVPIFGNATLLRGLEFELCDALAEELKTRTPVKIVTGHGDAMLSGAVIRYEKVPIYEVAGEVLAGRVKVTVTFKLVKDDEEKPVREGTVLETQDFDMRAGISEEYARRRAMREIARKIVYQLEAW